MKKIALLLTLLLSPFLLKAVTQSELFWENQPFTKTPKGFGLHTDLGYSSYLIELHSSEMDSAIDYDVLEATLGFSYTYGSWLVGSYGKFVVDEVDSNMYVVTTHAPLNNSATINKDEFALYVKYRFLESEEASWGLNAIYRYAVLDASDYYEDFFTYMSYFNYQTEGVALSLAYQKKLFEGVLASTVGVLYSSAGVEMSELVNGKFQDSFVNDNVNVLGLKVSLAYNYEYTENISLHLRTDAWRQKFNNLKVTSRVGDILPNASLNERSYTTYLGIAWKF